MKPIDRYPLVCSAQRSGASEQGRRKRSSPYRWFRPSAHSTRLAMIYRKNGIPLSAERCRKVRTYLETDAYIADISHVDSGRSRNSQSVSDDDVVFVQPQSSSAGAKSRLNVVPAVPLHYVTRRIGWRCTYCTRVVYVTRWRRTKRYTSWSCNDNNTTVMRAAISVSIESTPCMPNNNINVWVCRLYLFYLLQSARGSPFALVKKQTEK